MFKIIKQSNKSLARLAHLEVKSGVIQTPFFMPIATKGSVKSLTSQDLKNLQAQIILSNTYHLYLQPGLPVLKKHAGLHNFMNWPGPILTDSGGYQVFSLSAHTRSGKSLRKITRQGVEFKSFLDGSQHLFTPKKVQDIQEIIGSDIKMVLDVCSPHPCSKSQAQHDMQLTHLWAEQALAYHQKIKSKKLLFGIIQGATYKDLRQQSTQFLSALNFDGLAIGGLAVGESNTKMYQVLKDLAHLLPNSKPHYLMGIGKPENILQAVKYGIDMFDCVIPTREARHGRLYFFTGKKIDLTKKNFYQVIQINNSVFKSKTKNISSLCDCELCQNYSLSYLQHLFKAKEPLALRLATLHNLKFYLTLMQTIRQDIQQGKI